MFEPAKFKRSIKQIKKKNLNFHVPNCFPVTCCPNRVSFKIKAIKRTDKTYPNVNRCIIWNWNQEIIIYVCVCEQVLKEIVCQVGIFQFCIRREYTIYKIRWLLKNMFFLIFYMNHFIGGWSDFSIFIKLNVKW